MHHLLEHINRDIKGGTAKIRTQQYIKLKTGAKEIQQVNPVGPDVFKNVNIVTLQSVCLYILAFVIVIIVGSALRTFSVPLICLIEPLCF